LVASPIDGIEEMIQLPARQSEYDVHIIGYQRFNNRICTGYLRHSVLVIITTGKSGAITTEWQPN
jgi:hypothetical protein